jgi:hypothetical protein
MEPADPKEKRQNRLHLKRSKLLLPKLRTKALTTLFVMLREKRTIPRRHARSTTLHPKIEISEGALVFNGSDEEDFLYCLPDNKEISVCREIGKSIGFPKLEDGLSILSKDELADSLAYNSIKV